MMRDRSIAIVLFAMAFWAFAWMSPQDPVNTQIVTRMGLTMSIVEHGRLDIDNVADRTIDKARFGEHFYADKVPGQSLLAVPAVAAARAAFGALGWETDSRDLATFARYVLVGTLATNVLFSSIAVASLFLIARWLGAGQGAAVFAAGSLALATPFFGWSTAFFAHSLSGSLLLIGTGLVILTLKGRRTLPLAAVTGIVMSYTAVVDLTTAPSLVLLGLVALVLAWRRARLAPMLAGFAIGGTLGALPLLVYNQLAFGSPFRLGYSNVVGWEGMKQGVFGVQLPNPLVTAELLFGLYRGILPLAPVLILVPVGLWLMAQGRLARPFALLVGGVVLLHLTINSGYFYWNGGWSTGPRHLIPALPLAALALAWAWPHRKGGRVTVLVLLVASMVISILCAAGGMFAPEDLRNPFFESVLPNFLNNGSWPRLIPVLLAWGVLAWLLQRTEAAPLRTGSSAGLQAAAE